MDNHLDDIHRGCVSGMRGNGGLTTVHPALWNSSIWWQGRSGLDRTNPGPMTLKVASICIGLGSSKDNLCTRYPRSPRCRLIHSMPRLFVTCWTNEAADYLSSRIRNLACQMEKAVSRLVTIVSKYDEENGKLRNTGTQISFFLRLRQNNTIFHKIIYKVKNWNTLFDMESKK